MKRAIPGALIGIRLALGPALLVAALNGITGAWFVAGLAAGLLTDVLDGVLARRLKVATAALREADSRVDAVFCGFVALSVWVCHRETVIAFRTSLIAMVSAQALSLALDWRKYGRFSAYHAYSAKAAGAALFSAVALLLCLPGAGRALLAAVVIATLSHLERIAITLLLPEWTHDVPGVLHAWRLVNRGSEKDFTRR